MAKKIFDIVPPKRVKIRKKTEEKKNFSFVRLSKIFFFALVIALAGGGAALGILMDSEAQVDIWPKSKDIQAEEKVTLSLEVKEFDPERGIIPALLVENTMNMEKEFPSSGKAKEESKAAGTITVFNEYSDAPRTLLKSRFVSAEGKVFWSKDKVTIPGRTKEKNKIIPGQVQVKVEASEAGEDYNIGASTFALPALAGSPLYTAIYAKSFSPMSGGFIGQMDQVTEQDIENAKNSILEEARGKNKELLEEKLGEGMTIAESSILHEEIKKESSLPAGSMAKTFKYKITISSKAFSFKKSNMENLVMQMLESVLAADESIDEKTLRLDYVPDVSDSSEKETVLKMKISGKGYKKIESEDLKKSLIGRSTKEAEMLLGGLSGAERIEFRIKPFFKAIFPKQVENIMVKIKTD